MPRKSEGREYITITLTSQDYETIKLLAATRKTSMNEICREFITQGLNGSVTEKNLDIIAPVIRELLSSIIEPSTNRICSLLSKTYIQGATAAYLTAETIHKFVEPEKQEDVIEVYTAARKKAVADMKGNINIE